MNSITVGEFKIQLRGPYPVWVHIFYENERLCSIHHKEISDLQYALKKAANEARLLLKESKDEVLL